MLKRKKLLTVILAGVLAMSMMLTSCSSNKNMESSAQNELTFVNFRDIRDLNPHLYGGELYAQNLLFESLVKITENGIEPWLASTWNISEDGKEYTFHLREDVSFTDGVKFNAESAKANFDAVLDNLERHTWLEMVRLIESVEASDEYTLKITLSEAYYPMLTELAVTRPFRFISPNCMKNGTTKDGVDGYIGTGAYVLSENKTDEYAVFTVNENYWGEKPEVEKITVKVIPDNQTRVLALENGEIDLIYGKSMIDAETYNKFDDKAGFETAISDPISTRMMVVNTTDEILSDINVRMALEYAMDKDAIAEGIFSGIEKPANRILAKTVPYCDVDVNEYSYSSEKAAELLETAGWTLQNGSNIRQKDGKPLNITLHYNSDDVTEKAISEYYQSQLALIGVQLDIKGEEEQAYRDRMKAGNFDIIFNISWGTPYDPQSFMAGMKMPVYGDYAAQQGLAEKAKIDESILKALTTTDEEERQELYAYILRTLQDNAVYIPITFETSRAVFKDKVKNVTFNPSQFEVPLEKVTIE